MRPTTLLPIVLLLLLACPWAWAQKPGEPYRMRTVVIDPGHGGHDPGNLGTGRHKKKEKDIALDVSLRLGQLIHKEFPGLTVRYTRDKDEFIGLMERADFANKLNADIFISIHCNAAKNTAAQGVETFALGLHKSEENLQVAMKENASIMLEDNYESKYEGFDPNSPESIIALTIMQSAFLDQSLRISSYIQRQFKESVQRKDRGVKQAGFLVLRRTTMPSILIELGFLTNAQEEDFLNSENGREYMAAAIFRGFKEYKERVEDPAPAKPEPKPEPPKPEPRPEPVAKAEEKAPPVPAKDEKTPAQKEKERKEAELAAAKAEKERIAKALEEKKRKEEAERKAQEEADRLEAQRIAKEKELAEAKRKAEQEEKARMQQRLDREAEAEKARQEFAARLAEKEKARTDSIRQAHEAQRRRDEQAAALEPEKKTAPRPTEAKPAPQPTPPADAKPVPGLTDKAVTPEEAELLFLEKRRKELEERVARVKEEDRQREEMKKLEEARRQEQEAKAERVAAAQPQPDPAPDKGVVFRVQVMTSSNAMELSSPKFLGQAVEEYRQDGLYKYAVGNFRDYPDALIKQNELRNLGFPTAFVVAFNDGQRIRVADARELVRQ